MPLVVLKTNLSKASVPNNLMETVSTFIVKTMEAEEKLAMVEVHTDIPMLRAGTVDPMVNVEIHHNDNGIREGTKRDVAKKFANLLVDQLNVNIERVLVLFFDTRCTTMQEESTEL